MEQDVSGLVDFHSYHLGEDPKAFVADANPKYSTAIDAGSSDVVLERLYRNVAKYGSLTTGSRSVILLRSFPPPTTEVLPCERFASCRF